MEILDLEKELNSGTNEFIGKTIQISNKAFINENSLMFISGLTFRNCVFKGTHLKFENINMPDFLLQFWDCTLEISIEVNNCNLKLLGFGDCKSNKNINIIDGKYCNFFIRNSTDAKKKENIFQKNLTISKIKVEENSSMDNLNIIGNLSFSENILSSSKNKSRNQFSKSIYNKAFFRANKFLSKSYFENIETNGLFFHSCEFQKTKFNNTVFLKLTFSKCDFLSTTWFENCKNINHSVLRFVACEFKGFSLFNKSKINFLKYRCTFNKSSSFTDAEFNTLKLFEVKFVGGAYFDEMKINKVLDKSYLKDDEEVILEWKRTLRAIKQGSQKTENKIDFNRFRSYELAAHYKELSLWKNFKDTSILWSTKWTTDFGLSWTRAFWFTIISGFTWFSILYGIENNGTFDINCANEFFIGFFRFFLVTDFTNPFKEDKSYLDSVWSWIPFIFGKIFIAFGLYEMIQSFRKFKA